MSVVERPGWTPTEKRILVRLGDGMMHLPGSLMDCLDDELAGISTLYSHISRINRRLPPPFTIVSVMRYGKHYYQMFRRIDTSE